MEYTTKSNKYCFLRTNGGFLRIYLYLCSKNISYMEKNLLIELLETGEKVSLYSPRFEGEEYTEFEKFLLTYKDQYAQDVR